MAAYSTDKQKNKPVDPKDPRPEKRPLREIEVIVRAKEYAGGRYEFEVVKPERVPDHKILALFKQFTKDFLAGRVLKK